MANITNAASLIDSINSINTTYSPDTNTNSSAIKLSALQSEYKVVMTMYQNAYQNYITSVSSNIATATTHAAPISAAKLSVAQAQSAYDKANAAKTQAIAVVMPYYAYGSKTGRPPQYLLDKITAATISEMDAQNELRRAQSALSKANTTISPAYMELPGKQYWGTTGLQEGAVNSKDDCQTMCTNSLKCTGATYDSSLNYCWTRSGDGSIDTGSSQKNAIILNSEFPIIVLKMLNDKLIELNAAITNELQYAYSSTNQDQITNTQLSNQLAHLIHNKNRINKIIKSNNDTVEQELNESELYVTQSYTYYNLYFVIMLVLTALYIGNNVFSIITLILLILIITVNTTIFSGIAILLLLFVLFYLKSN